jgi:predicted nucleic acid-binding protein
VTRVVIDASAGVEMALRTALGFRLAAQIRLGAERIVPEHFFIEASGVLRRMELNSVISRTDAQSAFDRLGRLLVRRVAVRPYLADAWQMRHNFTIADAVYVVVARVNGAALVTADIRLANAPNLGVPIIG